MEADWFDAAVNGTAILEQKRSDAIAALRGAPSFSLTVHHGDRTAEHFAGASDRERGDAEAFVSLAALRAVQDMTACLDMDFDHCLDLLKVAHERGL